MKSIETFHLLLLIIRRNQRLELEIENLRERSVHDSLFFQTLFTNMFFVIHLSNKTLLHQPIALTLLYLNRSYEKKLDKKTAEVQHYAKR